LFSTIRRRLRSPLFPYTTLFRSDLVQEAYLRACRGFRGYRGGEPKAWLFAIVRSTFLTSVRREREWDDLSEADNVPDPAETPERSEEHTLNSSHSQISYAVFCLK